MQWLSLILLTVGCMIKEIPINNVQSITINDAITSFSSLDFKYGLLLVQITCSCFAGIYNEYLIKKSDQTIDICLHNIFMYIDSVFCNLFVIILQNNYTNVKNTFQILIILIIFNNAIAGIVTSYFLKYLNSILKVFANSLEIILSAIVCYFLFSIPILLPAFLSIFIVILSMYMYASTF